MKSFDSMLIRTLVNARQQLVRISTQLSNQIRGLMKTFGLIVPKGAGRVFDANVRELNEILHELVGRRFAVEAGKALVVATLARKRWSRRLAAT